MMPGKEWKGKDDSGRLRHFNPFRLFLLEAAFWTAGISSFLFIDWFLFCFTKKKQDEALDSNKWKFLNACFHWNRWSLKLQISDFLNIRFNSEQSILFYCVIVIKIWHL